MGELTKRFVFGKDSYNISASMFISESYGLEDWDKEHIKNMSSTRLSLGKKVDKAVWHHEEDDPVTLNLTTKEIEYMKKDALRSSKKGSFHEHFKYVYNILSGK